jgi:hypothetical protein
VVYLGATQQLHKLYDVAKDKSPVNINRSNEPSEFMEAGDKNDHRCLGWLKNFLLSMYRGDCRYIALNDQVIRDELRRRWEEAVMAFFNVQFQYSAQILTESTSNPDIRSLGTHSMMISPRDRLIFIWQSEVRVTQL